MIQYNILIILTLSKFRVVKKMRIEPPQAKGERLDTS